MSLFGGMMDSFLGAEVNHLVAGYINQNGGVAAIVAQFEQQGLGHIVQSWISSGQNLPVSAEQIMQVFGSGILGQLAAKFGLNPQDLAAKLSQVLPQVVDQMTPNGVV